MTLIEIPVSTSRRVTHKMGYDGYFLISALSDRFSGMRAKFAAQKGSAE
jgi:hypothetical protein